MDFRYDRSDMYDLVDCRTVIITHSSSRDNLNAAFVILHVDVYSKNLHQDALYYIIPRTFLWCSH